jgi:lipid A 3-O-deacylase
MKRVIAGAALIALNLLATHSSRAAVPEPDASRAPALEPTRTGLAVSCGISYNPSGVDFCLLTGILLFDYDRVWPHKAPESLRFRVEYSLGAIVEPETRLMTSANMIAQFYYHGMSASRVRPYIGGGIGIIYTDFKVEGQGLKFNFNPLLGAGVEFGPDPSLFLDVRIHHISNGGLDDENTGVNSVQFMLGRYF